MELPEKTQKYFLYAIIVLLVMLTTFFGIQTSIKTAEAHKAQNALVTSEYNSKMAFDSIRNKDGSTIATQQQLLTQKDNEIVKHIEKENNLKSLNAQVTVKTVYQVQRVFVPYTDSTPGLIVIDTVSGKIDTTNYVHVPATVSSKDSNFLIRGTVTKSGLIVNNLNIPNTVTVTIGETKGLFKHKSIVTVKQSNPYIETEDVKNIVVEQAATKKAVKTFFIGGGVGAAIATTLIILLTHFSIK